MATSYEYNDDSTLLLILEGHELADVGGWFGSTDPFFMVMASSPTSTGSILWQKVYTSEEVPACLQPRWKKAEINLHLLCKLNLQKPIRIQVDDWEPGDMHNPMGYFDTTVGDLLQVSGDSSQTAPLRDGEGNVYGKLIVRLARIKTPRPDLVEKRRASLRRIGSLDRRCSTRSARSIRFDDSLLDAQQQQALEKLVDKNAFWYLTLEGKDFVSVAGWFETNNPYFQVAIPQINPQDQSTVWQTVYRSEPVMDSLSPVWKEANINLFLLCGGDLLKPFRIFVLNHLDGGKPAQFGYLEASIAEMIKASNHESDNEFLLQDDKGNEVGQIKVLHAQLPEEFSDHASSGDEDDDLMEEPVGEDMPAVTLSTDSNHSADFDSIDKTEQIQIVLNQASGKVGSEFDTDSTVPARKPQHWDVQYTTRNIEALPDNEKNSSNAGDGKCTWHDDQEEGENKVECQQQDAKPEQTDLVALVANNVIEVQPQWGGPNFIDKVVEAHPDKEKDDGDDKCSKFDDQEVNEDSKLEHQQQDQKQEKADILALVANKLVGYQFQSNDPGFSTHIARAHSGKGKDDGDEAYSKVNQQKVDEYHKLEGQQHYSKPEQTDLFALVTNNFSDYQTQFKDPSFTAHVAKAHPDKQKDAGTDGDDKYLKAGEQVDNNNNEPKHEKQESEQADPLASVANKLIGCQPQPQDSSCTPYRKNEQSRDGKNVKESKNSNDCEHREQQLEEGRKLKQLKHQALQPEQAGFESYETGREDVGTGHVAKLQKQQAESIGMELQQVLGDEENHNRLQTEVNERQQTSQAFLAASQIQGEGVLENGLLRIQQFNDLMKGRDAGQPGGIAEHDKEEKNLWQDREAKSVVEELEINEVLLKAKDTHQASSIQLHPKYVGQGRFVGAPKRSGKAPSESLVSIKTTNRELAGKLPPQSQTSVATVALRHQTSSDSAQSNLSLRVKPSLASIVGASHARDETESRHRSLKMYAQTIGRFRRSFESTDPAGKKRHSFSPTENKSQNQTFSSEPSTQAGDESVNKASATTGLEKNRLPPRIPSENSANPVLTQGIVKSRDSKTENADFLNPVEENKCQPQPNHPLELPAESVNSSGSLAVVDGAVSHLRKEHRKLSPRSKIERRLALRSLDSTKKLSPQFRKQLFDSLPPLHDNIRQLPMSSITKSELEVVDLQKGDNPMNAQKGSPTVASTAPTEQDALLRKNMEEKSLLMHYSRNLANQVSSLVDGIGERDMLLQSASKKVDRLLKAKKSLEVEVVLSMRQLREVSEAKRHLEEAVIDSKAEIVSLKRERGLSAGALQSKGQSKSHDAAADAEVLTGEEEIGANNETQDTIAELSADNGMLSQMVKTLEQRVEELKQAAHSRIMADSQIVPSTLEQNSMLDRKTLETSLAKAEARAQAYADAMIVQNQKFEQLYAEKNLLEGKVSNFRNVAEKNFKTVQDAKDLLARYKADRKKQLEEKDALLKAAEEAKTLAGTHKQRIVKVEQKLAKLEKSVKQRDNLIQKAKEKIKSLVTENSDLKATLAPRKNETRTGLQSVCDGDGGDKKKSQAKSSNLRQEKKSLISKPGYDSTSKAGHQKKSKASRSSSVGGKKRESDTGDTTVNHQDIETVEEQAIPQRGQSLVLDEASCSTLTQDVTGSNPKEGGSSAENSSTPAKLVHRKGPCDGKRPSMRGRRKSTPASLLKGGWTPCKDELTSHDKTNPGEAKKAREQLASAVNEMALRRPTTVKRIHPAQVRRTSYRVGRQQAKRAFDIAKRQSAVQVLQPVSTVGIDLENAMEVEPFSTNLEQEGGPDRPVPTDNSTERESATRRIDLGSILDGAKEEDLEQTCDENVTVASALLSKNEKRLHSGALLSPTKEKSLFFRSKKERNGTTVTSSKLEAGDEDPEHQDFGVATSQKIEQDEFIREGAPAEQVATGESRSALLDTSRVEKKKSRKGFFSSSKSRKSLGVESTAVDLKKRTCISSDLILTQEEETQRVIPVDSAAVAVESGSVPAYPSKAEKKKRKGFFLRTKKASADVEDADRKSENSNQDVSTTARQNEVSNQDVSITATQDDETPSPNNLSSPSTFSSKPSLLGQSRGTASISQMRHPRRLRRTVSRESNLKRSLSVSSRRLAAGRSFRDDHPLRRAMTAADEAPKLASAIGRMRRERKSLNWKDSVGTDVRRENLGAEEGPGIDTKSRKPFNEPSTGVSSEGLKLLL